MTWYRFGEWILRRRFLVLGVVGALTAFFGYYAAQTQLVTSFGDLLPQNHPFIQVAHKYDQYFGSVNNVTIMIEAKEGTIYNAEDHREDRPHDATTWISSTGSSTARCARSRPRAISARWPAA